MSYKRRVRKNIPKNTNSCENCKNISIVKNYREENETNSVFKDACKLRCNYMKIESTNETVRDFLNSINVILYSDEDIEKIVSDLSKANDLHNGKKICGMYLEKNTAKACNREEIELNEEDIPFY